MSLVGGVIPCIAAGIGTLTARAYQATWEQSHTFATVDFTVCLLLSGYLSPAMNAKSLRQRMVLDLTCRIISCLSGVLATRLFCEKIIHLRAAVIAQFASNFSANFLTHFYRGESGAMSMKV